MLLYLPSAKDARGVENNKECKIMERLSEKLTKYVIKAGVVSKELYAIYQYGFQIGLEMLCCFITCLIIAVYLHMIPEFIVFTIIFILLRTYAGGVHLNSFWSCYLCSVVVQTIILIISDQYILPIYWSWTFIAAGSGLILKHSPVETLNRELDSDERLHCKKITMRIIAVIIALAGCCTLGNMYEITSLIAWSIIVVWISQYIGVIKFKIEKKYKHG